MRIATCLAVMAALLFLVAPPAPAATTTMKIKVSNQSGQGVIVEVRGKNYYEVKNLAPSGQTSFIDQDTAWLLKPTVYTYNMVVYSQKDHSVICEGVFQERNTWDMGPKVMNCRANI